MSEFVLSEESLALLLNNILVEVDGETGTDYLCFCPFHDNKHTAAFNISKYEPGHPWRCWNQSCARTGTILGLVASRKELSPLQALTYIRQFNPQSVMKKKTIERKYQTFDEDILDNLDTNIDRLQYMIDRGFTKETLRYFGVGYEDGFIVVPVFDEKFKLVGFTCRNVTGTNPKYKDTGLPKKFLLFNLNNARRYDEVIIVEGPLDAMRVHQAGFPNVVATMMGDLTKWQAELLRNTFRSAIIFTDNDEPGRELGEAIVERLQGIRRYWAEFEGKKDPGEMSDNEIKTVIENKKSHILRQIQGDGHN